MAETANTSSRARAFLHDVVNLRLSDAWLWKHVTSMIGPVAEYTKQTGRPMALIGHLESFDSDWARLQKLMQTRVKLPAFSRNCMGHNYSSTLGTFTARKFLKDVVYPDGDTQEGATQDLQNARALHCAVLLPEYVCFGYDNSITPGQCVEAGYAPSLQSWNTITDTIRDNFCPGHQIR